MSVGSLSGGACVPRQHQQANVRTMLTLIKHNLLRIDDAKTDRGPRPVLAAPDTYLSEPSNYGL